MLARELASQTQGPLSRRSQDPNLVMERSGEGANATTPTHQRGGVALPVVL